MKLVSDFWDYYDIAFDGLGKEFRRVTTDGPTRREMFSLLEQYGFRTPPHGLVKDVSGMWWDLENRWVRQVVMYENETVHRGEGKTLIHEHRLRWDGCLTRIPALDRLHNLYCSAYVGSYPPKPGLSWRLLQVGKRRFWIEYQAEEDWRSNVGDGDITLLGEEDPFACGKLPYPLYAVDFVIGKEAYAIDLNIAPGVRGTGVERLLTPREFVTELTAIVQ